MSLLTKFIRKRNIHKAVTLWNRKIKMLLPSYKSITVAGAAEAIGCSESHVRLLLRNKKLVGQKVSPRHWVVKKASVDKFISLEQLTGRPRLKQQPPI